MSIDNPTLAHFRHFSSFFTNFSSTTVEIPLQISSFMQNKANFPESQMNVTKVLTKDYEDKTRSESGKNKANLLNAQMNVTTFQTKAYENISNCTLAENKANTKPIQTQSNPTCRGVASGEDGSKAKKSCCRGNPHASHRAGAVTKFVTLSLTLLGIDANLLALQFKEDDLWNCPG